MQWLNHSNLMPDPRTAPTSPDGLLCVGGDLSVARLIRAYELGVFPWFSKTPILWWSPHPRCMLPTAGLNISARDQRRFANWPMRLTTNLCFSTVLQRCAAPRDGERGTWIGADMQRAYQALNALGRAHSVELWLATDVAQKLPSGPTDAAPHISGKWQLAGALYGVQSGSAFAAESMFSGVTNGSKALLQQFAAWCQLHGIEWIDAQVSSPHLLQLGAEEWSRPKFLSVLAEQVRRPLVWPAAGELSLSG
jgi:leucyl/phenylalanyl-tRNA---protein transferase